MKDDEPFWTTVDGTEIPYSKIKDDHLLNIIKFIERRAETGITVSEASGFDVDDMFITDREISGEEALEYMDYEGIVHEAESRKLI